jgi:hypothetical protein
VTLQELLEFAQENKQNFFQVVPKFQFIQKLKAFKQFKMSKQ